MSSTPHRKRQDRLRILIVNQYVFAKGQAGSSRVVEYASRLASEGHEVTVVTSFIDNFRREVPRQYRGRWLLRERADQYTTIRVWCYTNYQGSAVRRVIHMLTFTATALFALPLVRKADVVLGSSPPLTTGIPAWVIARLAGARFIFEVRDLWPDAATELGILPKNSVLVRAGKAVEAFLYRVADSILVVTPGLKRYLVQNKGIDASGISVVTNGISADVAGWSLNATEERARLGFEGYFNIVQAGGMSVGDQLEILIDAAALVQDEKRIRFVLIGDGEVRPRLEAQVAKAGLQNVVFIGPQPKTEIGRFLKAADATVVLVHSFYADCALPNRFFDCMAAGRPIITSGTGDMGKIVDEAGAGLVIPPDDPRALADAVLRLFRDPALCAGMGENGPRHILHNYSWERLYPQYRRVYSELYSPGGAAPTIS
jgi:glycosyltransferase involved in cell wall biosynthesis